VHGSFFARNGFDAADLHKYFDLCTKTPGISFVPSRFCLAGPDRSSDGRLSLALHFSFPWSPEMLADLGHLAWALLEDPSQG
jgi:hypothetical protein